MPECPICRRLYDGRFQVFVPPYDRAFDSIECARRAAEVGALDEVAPVPVVSPAIEIVPARSEAQVASAASRRGVAALGALVIPPGQAALATAVGLFAAGTSASIYLWATGPASHGPPVAAGVPHTPQTNGPNVEKTQPSTSAPRPPRRRATRPSATGKPSAGSRPRANGPAPPRPPTAATEAVQVVSTSAAQAQYGTYRPPFEVKRRAAVGKLAAGRDAIAR